MLWRCIRACAVFFATLIPAATGHVTLSDPPSRNAIHNSNWCPHCLDAGGAGAVYPTWSSRVKKYGVCGDPYKSRRDHEAGGRYATKTVRKTYKSGQKIRVRVDVSANHRGRISMRLCALPDRSESSSRERGRTTQRCFDRAVLRQSGGATYMNVKSNARRVTGTYVLPRGVRCKRCVIQMWYETGNSCCPRGLSRTYCGSGVSTCGKWALPEEFWNCADVRIA